jgi:CRISPR-associated endoribonuclease Cas6
MIQHRAIKSLNLGALAFDLLSLRFHFVAREAIHFPMGKAGNVLRGAFGAACVETAAYARIFAPESAAGPSGLADPPRPFVFRARHLDGRDVEAGEAFHFEVNLFDLRPDTVACLIEMMSAVARQGLGPARGRAAFDRVERQTQCLSLDPPPDPITRVQVDFLTPTELKGGDRLAPRPEFPILFARIRDRLSMLSALYGSGPLPIDFRGMGERAAQVRMPRCDIRHVAVQRRSSRTGQTHGIGGFIGSAEYEGELAEFLPYLEAARWTGVGRQTVWGKGEVRLA